MQAVWQLFPAQEVLAARVGMPVTPVVEALVEQEEPVPQAH